MSTEFKNVIFTPQVIYGIIAFFTVCFTGVCGVIWKLWTENYQIKIELEKQTSILEKDIEINKLKADFFKLNQENELLVIKHNLEIQNKENQINWLQKELELLKSISIGTIYESAKTNIENAKSQIEIYKEEIHNKQITINSLSQEKESKEFVITNIQQEISLVEHHRNELEKRVEKIGEGLVEIEKNLANKIVSLSDFERAIFQLKDQDNQSKNLEELQTVDIKVEEKEVLEDTRTDFSINISAITLHTALTIFRLLF